MDDIRATDNASTILNAGRALGQAQIIDGVPIIVAPEGYTVHELDLESYLPAPKRCHGNVKIETVESFLSYIDRNKVAESTVVFADMGNETFTAIFNYHASGVLPGWGDNKATLTLTPTASWSRWIGKNGQRMDQLAFADFIEENKMDIITPSAAEVMEMVQALKVSKRASFHSIIDQRTGRQTLEYSEDTKGETAKGNLEFTGQFELALRPYRNRGTDEAPYKVNARLRFSITEQGQGKSKLSVHYSLVNHELVREHAFSAELDRIDQHLKAIAVPMFDGSPR